MEKLYRVKNRHEFYRLKKGCKVFKEENIEPDIGKPYKIHSPYSNEFHDSRIEEYTNFELLDSFIKEGNIYVS